MGRGREIRGVVDHAAFAAMIYTYGVNPYHDDDVVDDPFDNECRRGNLLRRVSDGRRKYPRHCHVIAPNDNCPEWEEIEVQVAEWPHEEFCDRREHLGVACSNHMRRVKEFIVVAWAEPANDPGWGNTPIRAIVQEMGGGPMRQVWLQPDEQTQAMLTLYRVNATSTAEMTRLVAVALGVDLIT